MLCTSSSVWAAVNLTIKAASHLLTDIARAAMHTLAGSQHVHPPFMKTAAQSRVEHSVRAFDHQTDIT